MMFLKLNYAYKRHFKISLVKAFIVFMLSIERVDAEGTQFATCEGDCEGYSSPQAEYLAKEVTWKLDLAIEAQPIYSQDPREIFAQLFHVVNRDGQMIAGLTETMVDLSSVHWSARISCEKKPANQPRNCYIVNPNEENFEIVDLIKDLITGGPENKPSEELFEHGLSASTSMFYKGKGVVRPRAQVRVFVGWPTIGLQNIPVEWKKPITEAIFMILGHEKLHVDNFIRHLPEIAEIVLHPPVTSFEVLPGEDPFEKLDVAARAAAVQQINKKLYDPDYSDCKRMNCIYDGKGPDCKGSAEHTEQRLAAEWETPQEWNPKGWDVMKLGMFIDKNAQYPGLKSPNDFKIPKRFDFRWSQEASE